MAFNKVLYIMHMPPPVHGASMVGQYIRDSKLLQHRFESDYINLTAASDLNDIGQLGVKKLVNYVRMLFAIRKHIKKEKPHVVYITPNAAGRPFYKDFLTVCLVKHWCKKNRDVKKTKRKPNILVHFHNKGVKEFSKSKLNNWLYEKFFKDLYVLLLSEVLYEDVKKYVPPSRVGFCGNGLPALSCDEEKRVSDKIRQKYADQTNHPLHLLYLSNMMEEKGVWTLVEACKILKNKGVDFKCTFVGGWKDISEDLFRQKINSMGLDADVIAVGPKYNQDKEQYWLDADVFVFPSYYHNECFPLVLLEAMQHALPCISTKEGAIPDIIDDGETGFVVDAKNPGYLAVKIEELATDKDKRLSMGIEGYRKFNKQYSLKVFENRICEVLEQLM